MSISEGPSSDRIITITGTLEEMYDACRSVIERFDSVSTYHSFVAVGSHFMFYTSHS